MSNLLEQIEEIQKNIREIKGTWGNTIMTLDNIKSGLKSDVQKKVDEAYQKGYKDCETRCFDAYPNMQVEYQRGLDDAWKAARKIALGLDDGGFSTHYLKKVFGSPSFQYAFKNYSASEAIKKLKDYEEKQKASQEIKVGDEVAFHHDDGRPDTVVVVTYIGQDGFIDGMDGRGTQYAHKNPTKWTKTGRHFDIDKILKEMNDES